MGGDGRQQVPGEDGGEGTSGGRFLIPCYCWSRSLRSAFQTHSLQKKPCQKEVASTHPLPLLVVRNRAI